MLLIGAIRDLVDQVFGISYLFRFARFITRSGSCQLELDEF